LISNSKYFSEHILSQHILSKDVSICP